jgi:type III secretion system (T3SS) SseB-like protein
VLNAIRKLLGKKNAASPGSPQEGLLGELAASTVWVFAAMQGDGLDAKSMTPEQLLAELRRAAEELARQQEFAPFVYERDGQSRLPFFTSEDHAQVFAGEYAKERNRVYPFEMLGVKGALLPKLSTLSDVLVMNDRSPDEVVLTPGDLGL